MSISSLSISRVGAIPRTWKERSGNEGRKTMVVEVECSSRPQKKATSHHIKTRPKKHQAWDIKRKPTVYPPLPTLPPDWTLLERPPASSSSEEEEEAIDAVAEDTKEELAVERLNCVECNQVFESRLGQA